MTAPSHESTIHQLRMDAKSSHGDLSHFIADVYKDMHTSGVKPEHVKADANRALKENGILPGLAIEGVSEDGKSLRMADLTGTKHFLVGANERPVEIKEAPGAVPGKANQDGIERDEHGRIKSEKRAQMEYDQVGHLKSLTVDGTKYQENAKGEWSDGKGNTLDSKPTINQKNGDINIKAQGENMFVHADGSSLSYGPTGHLDAASDTHGDFWNYSYDRKGNLTGINTFDVAKPGPNEKVNHSEHLVKQPDGTWKDKDSGQTFKDAGVNKSGELYEVDNKGNKTTFHLDGSNDVSKAPAEPPTEHQKWLHDRKQARIDGEKDIKDHDSHTIKHGDTMWDIASASLKAHGDKYPTAKEIHDEVGRLAKNNKIANPDHVPIGTVIDTSTHDK